MLEFIINGLRAVPKGYIVMFVAVLPMTGVGVAIPLALYFGMSISEALWLSVIFNLIPIVPFLILLEPLSRRLRRFKFWAGFFDRLFARAKKKAELIQKYQAFGLAMFVALPIPMASAWTAAVAASLFKIKFRYAFAAIVLGVIAAGCIILSLCVLGIITWQMLVA
jgi:uncharacterized membrane protein